MRHDPKLDWSRTAVAELPLEVAIIVPVLNEAANVERLIAAVSVVLAGRGWELLFVDDNSGDGTADLVRQIGRTDRHIRVVQRLGRRGLSSAVVEGMLATSAPVLVVMDGDLQHDEAILPSLIDAVANGGADLAVGTRYCDGGGVGEWDQQRQLVSRVATRLGQTVLGVTLADPMSGYFAVSRRYVESALPRISQIGFKILLDIVASAPTPPQLAEIPFTFRTREAGESKIGAKVIVDYLELLADKSVGKWIPVRLLKFLSVGALGLIVHLAILKAILSGGGSFVTAQSIAVLSAIAFNFALNNLFTYADRRLRGWKMLGGLASFYAISAVGALANIGIGTWAAGQEARWWVAGMAGVVIGAMWNFTMSAALTWRK